MKWNGRLTRAERAERDERLLAALEHASNGGAEWVLAEAVVNGLGMDHYRLPWQQRITTQAAGRALSRLADEGRCRVERGAFARFTTGTPNATEGGHQ